MNEQFKNSSTFKKHLNDLVDRWRREGMPPRQQVVRAFGELITVRESSGLAGLWQKPPLLVTATLDDGWGHGLEIIEACARAAGVKVVPLGLLVRPEAIIAACAEHAPDLLGLTVLQLSSEDALSLIGSHLPPQTTLVAGGPPFVIDPELGSRCGVHFTARNVADFLDFLLKSDHTEQ